MTAHVDFTAVDGALESHGFVAVGQVSQAAFLKNLGIERFTEAERLARGQQLHQMAIRELTKPDGLGAFRVAVHARSVEPGHVTGLHGAAEEQTELPPLIRPDPSRHLNLMAGRHPHAAAFNPPDWEQLFRDGP
jgi:hypothetical protein